MCFHAHVLLRCPCLHTLYIWTTLKPTVPLVSLQCPSPLRNWLSTPQYHVKGKKVKVVQSCPTLCDPMDCTVHLILQASILEWVAFPFSRGSSQRRDRTRDSRVADGVFTSWATREASSTTYLVCVYIYIYIFFFFFHNVAQIASHLYSYSISIYWACKLYQIMSWRASLPGRWAARLENSDWCLQGEIVSCTSRMQSAETRGYWMVKDNTTPGTSPAPGITKWTIERIADFCLWVRKVGAT